MDLSPYKLLQEAIKAVPAVRYALGLAGIASVIAIVAGFQISYKVAIFGTLIIIGLMFILLIFSSLASQKSKRSLRLPALTLAWSFLVLSIMSSTLLAISFFFSWPRDIASYFPPTSSQEVKITIRGKILSSSQQPVIDAEVTIDGYNFSTRSNEKGEFMSLLREVKTGEIITLRIYHKDYKSFSINRKIENAEEHFKILLDQRHDR